MSRIGKCVQAQNERKRYQIDYTDWLDVGETVSTVTFAVLVNTPARPLVVDGIAVLPTTLGVQFYISGGLDNAIYEIIATLTTTQTQVRVDGIIVSIREP
jgi:hypothetical protein